MTTKNDSPIIYYIPGLYSADDPQKEALKLLNTIYPNAKQIKTVTWENQNGKNIKLDLITTTTLALDATNPLLALIDLARMTVGSIQERWDNALNDVVPTSELLANEIANLSSTDRQKLILIGHSLGGNIVIRTLANLYRRDVTIHSAVLLGAAIDNMEPQILSAVKATQDAVFSMVNPDDAILNLFFKTATGNRALGTGCELECDYSKFQEHYTSNSMVHSSVFYLSQWAAVNKARRDFDKIQVQQPSDSLFNIPVKTMDIDKLWTIVDHYMGWKLERSSLGLPFYRILDPNLRHRAWSFSETKIKESFNDIKKQIEQLIDDSK